MYPEYGMQGNLPIKVTPPYHSSPKVITLAEDKREDSL